MIRLIDANALIDDWNKAIKRMVRDSDGKTPVDFGLVIREVSKAHSVDAVEVVHGRWLKTCLPDIYHCTNCKRATKMDELCDSEILRAYCPNCGAKMDGDGNE